MPTANFSAVLTLAAALAAGGSVWAQPALLATPEEAARAVAALQETTWLDEIAEIEAQTSILQKREELDTRLIEAQMNVLQKREELETLVRETTAEMLAHLPSVVSIMAIEGKYQSQIYYPSGRLTYVRVGDQISPDVKVVEISLSGVEVNVTLGRDREQRRVPLNFVSLAERRVDTVDKNTRGQVEAAKDVVLPREAGTGDSAVANMLRALASSQTGN